ncbi:Salicylic acid-binding protein 2, partial [Mucuna pruriens]
MDSKNCMDRKHYVLVHGTCHGAWCWYKLKPRLVSAGHQHYVLVHGACYGAWLWYKVKPRLESAGHKVTVLDLAASGANMKKIEDVDTFSEYSEPLLQLLASIPPKEKVVLVGHSLGGLNIALAMDKFPEKIAVGVFVTAIIPDVEHKPSYVMEKYIESMPEANWLDTEFSQNGNKTIVVFGPKFLSNKLYQASSIEDIELAKALLRPGSLFVEDLSQQKNFSKQGYGSVPLAFIVSTEDNEIPLSFQLWMIQNAGINVDVVEINGADHMVMISKPQELCDSLLQIAAKYA